MAYNQQHYLRQVGEEGFQLIEEQYGRSSRLVDNHVQYQQWPLPRPVTVFQKPIFSSTSVTYFNEATRVPPPTQGHGGQNSSQVPPTIRAKEPVIKTSGGWHICRVPQVSTGKGDVITSDQAAKTYGGYLIRDY